MEISRGNEKHEVTVAPPDGGIDLTPLRLGLKTAFTVSMAGDRLLTTTQEDLSILDGTVELMRSSLCLDIRVEEESLSPVSPTTVFYADDIQMVVFAELAGVCRPLPMLVSWWYRKRPYFVTVGEIPPLPQESETASLVRSYAFGFFIDPALPKGTWEVRLDLPTGRNLCRIEVRLLEGKRPRFGESGTLFRPKPEGGRILDKLG